MCENILSQHDPVGRPCHKNYTPSIIIRLCIVDTESIYFKLACLTGSTVCATVTLMQIQLFMDQLQNVHVFQYRMKSQNISQLKNCEHVVNIT